MRRDLVPTVTSLKGSLPKLPELGIKRVELAREVSDLENDFVDVI
jgi:hypothetical protein